MGHPAAPPVGLVPGLAPSVVLFAASGLFSAHDIVTQATYVREASAEHRGQAVGLAIAALRAAQGVGIVLAGVLAQLFQPSGIIAAAAALGTVAAAAAVIRWSRAAGSQ